MARKDTEGKAPFDKGPENEHERLERMLARMDRHLDEIETGEILHGFSSEELEQKGYLGKERITPARSEYARQQRTGGLVFEKGVEYEIMETYAAPGDIPIEEIEYLGCVQTGQRVATMPLQKKDEHRGESALSSLFPASYLDTCNCTISREEGTIVFTAAIQGRAVVLDGYLYLISADRDGYVEVTLAQDRMQAWLSVFPAKGNASPLDSHAVTAALTQKNVAKGIDTDAVNATVHDAQQTGKARKEVVIARGEPPRDGTDASYQINFTKEPAGEHIKILPDGRIDYRGQADIPIVRDGDLLATVAPPQQGKDGFDVTGAVLPAYVGEKDVLHCGENVRVEEKDDYRYFYATCTGQAVLNSGVINVYQQYTVEGNVDYASGNIDFTGNVLVKGSVLRGFEVKASGDVTVLKNIDGGHVNAGRDLIVAGGIVATLDTQVTCDRNCEVNYLQNARIEAQGDVYVKNAAIQSEIYCTGTIYCTEHKGALVGGTFHALRGIEARHIGSSQGAKTRCIVGNDYLIRKKIKELEDIITFMRKSVKKLDDILVPVIKALKKGVPLGDDKKRKIRQVQAKRQRMLTHIKTLKWKISELEKIEPKHLRCEIRVRDTVYPDVVLKIRDRTKRITSEHTKEKFYYNPKTDGLQNASL
jgi:hypothetical protein